MKEKSEKYNSINHSVEGKGVLVTGCSSGIGRSTALFLAKHVKKPKNRYRIGYMSDAAAMLEYFPQTFVDFLMALRW